MLVKAKERAFYDNRIINAGDTFEIPSDTPYEWTEEVKRRGRKPKSAEEGSEGSPDPDDSGE